ncbi:hypothetical protein JVT61DRAFT_13547 [Boletus reticuloceps]|uniref:Uncharacterized protein n=1 Tax=Boletus reticuloceps TaxID=495285 RepID=A0A8I3A3Q3_9AGAM|nr:hypothetical protein JVT61DRAFT_13547 [Boletus reticuloceps]
MLTLPECILQALVKSTYEDHKKTVDVEMENNEEDSDKESKIPTEDRLKLKFNHWEQRHDGNVDNNKEPKEKHIIVKEHAMSISRLFSPFENKNHLLALSQPVEEPM